MDLELLFVGVRKGSDDLQSIFMDTAQRCKITHHKTKHFVHELKVGLHRGHPFDPHTYELHATIDYAHVIVRQFLEFLYDECHVVIWDLGLLVFDKDLTYAGEGRIDQGVDAAFEDVVGQSLEERVNQIIAIGWVLRSQVIKQLNQCTEGQVLYLIEGVVDVLDEVANVLLWWCLYRAAFTFDKNARAKEGL